MPAENPRRQMDTHCRKTEAPCPAGQDRWELLDLVVALRVELRLNDRDIAVLRAHLGVLAKGPLHPARLNMSYMNVEEVRLRANGMEEMKFRRGEQALEKAGLIHRKRSANGRRYPIYDGSGKVVDAYGIDLSPLLFKRREFEQRLAELTAESAVLSARQSALSARLQELIRSMAFIPRSLADILDGLRKKLRNLLRRKRCTPEELDRVEETLVRLEASCERAAPSGRDTEDRDDADAPEERPARSLATSESAVSEPRTERHDDHLSSDKMHVDAEQNVRHIESSQKESSYPHDLEAKLRKDLASAWLNCAQVAPFHPRPPTTPEMAYDLLCKFAGYLGLGRDIVANAISQTGYGGTVVMLDYLSEKLGSVENINGYARSMLKSHALGNSIAAGRVKPGRFI